MTVSSERVVRDEASWPQVRVASYLAGTGVSIPERVVPNDYFASYLETNDAWIRERTGIAERRWVAPDTSASALAEPAAREAIARAGLQTADIDAIVVDFYNL